MDAQTKWRHGSRLCDLQRTHFPAPAPTSSKILAKRGQTFPDGQEIMLECEFLDTRKTEASHTMRTAALNSLGSNVINVCLKRVASPSAQANFTN